MTAGLKQAGADQAFKTGLHNASLYLALFSAEGVELAGNGYARQPIALADWDDSGAQQVNHDAVTWGPPQPAAWLAVTHWGLFDALTNGNLLYDVELGTATAAPGIGALVSAAAETIGFEFTGDGIGNVGSLAMMKKGLVSGTRYLMFSDNAAPQSDAGTGTSNIINTDGSVGSDGSGTPLAVQVAAGVWTPDNNGGNRRLRNNAPIDIGTQSVDLPDPASLLLCDGNAHTSNILWWNALTSDNPRLGDTLSFATNSISILLGITTSS